VPLSGEPAGAQGVHPSDERRCPATPRQPVARRLPPQPEHRLPAGLRGLLGLCLDPHSGGKLHWKRSFRRTWRANCDLSAQIAPAKATSEHYALFRRYLDARHGEGGMADMTLLDFAAMVEETFVDTRLIEYRLRPKITLAGPDSRQGRLVGVALTDVLHDGLSMIYSFFDPDFAPRSLGTYMILEHVDRTRRLGLPYVYLGYWVMGSSKMDYKSRFLPQERLLRDGWTLIDDA
jgi:leucyl-tRNA---protein transferase